MSHAPDTEAWRDELADYINDGEREVGTSEKWAWLDRLWNLQTFAPLTLQVADYTLTNIGTAAGFQFATPTQWATNDFKLLEGHSFLEGGLEYVIERVTTIVSGPTTFYQVTPDPRWNARPSDEIIELRLDRYLMPIDMAELYNVMSRDDDFGPLRELSLRTEEWMLLNRDDSPAEPTAILASHNLPSTSRDPREWYDNDRIAAPTAAINLTTSAGGGFLVPGQEYEYRYCWKWAGMLSPPSPSAKVTIPAGDNAVGMNSLEIWGLGIVGYGRTRVFFRRTLEGQWQHIGELEDSLGLVFADLGIPQTEPKTTSREREWLNGGAHRHYRLWPPPSVSKNIEVRYLGRLPRLVAKTDEPFMPVEFHAVIVHHVCRELSQQANNDKMVLYHTKRLDELLRLMRRRGLISDGQLHVRRSMFADHVGIPQHIVKPPVFLG